MFVKFTPIENVEEESDKNLEKDALERFLLISWTDSHDEAIQVADTIYNSYTCLWCTPHKSFEHFKEWFVEREKLVTEDDGLYTFPDEPFVYWNPPVGFDAPEKSIFNTTKGNV